MPFDRGDLTWLLLGIFIACYGEMSRRIWMNTSIETRLVNLNVEEWILIEMWCYIICTLVCWSSTVYSSKWGLFFVPGVDNSPNMVLKYSSVDLQRLNSFSRLSGGIYNRCAALGITRRHRYIHRGSRRDPFVRTSTVSQDNFPIPVIWSPHRRSSIRSNG